MERYLKPLQKETFLTQDEVWWELFLLCEAHTAFFLGEEEEVGERTQYCRKHFCIHLIIIIIINRSHYFLLSSWLVLRARSCLSPLVVGSLS